MAGEDTGGVNAKTASSNGRNVATHWDPERDPERETHSMCVSFVLMRLFEC